LSRKNAKRMKNDVNIEKSPVQKGKNKKTKKNKKVLKRIIFIATILLIILSGYLAYSTVINGGGLQGFLAAMRGHNQQTLEELPEIRFLLLGESTGMTDTIIVGSYNPKTQNASMLSIPRDTFVGKNEKKATASDKINSIYHGENSDKILKEVNELTGLNLEYYVSVDTKALRELVDSIGGVDFYVPINMDYDDTSKENYLRIHLKEGNQKLTGAQAEQLVRFRHNNNGSTYPSEYGQEDIGRMRTQREFITAALKQTLTPANLLKISDFINIIEKNVKTNIPSSLIMDYAPYAVNFNSEDLKTDTLPGVPEKLNGVWVYLQNKSESQIVINNLFFGGSYDIENQVDEASETTTIQVLNGSGNFSNLEKVVIELKEKGYTIVKAGNTSTTSKTTIVNRTKKEESVSTELKNILGIGTISTGKDSEKADFTITIGKDYK